MTDFFDKVYEVVKRVPVGYVTTYGQIAKLVGNPRASRAVGWALHVNPTPIVIPCHRVVDKNGYVAKSFAFGGEQAQKSLLLQEGVTFLENGAVDFTKHLWRQ